MKKILLLLYILFISLNTQAQTEIFDTLLKKHVSILGNVDYSSLKNEEVKLDAYLDYLAKTTPSKNWSDNAIKAFWINAYNAYTIKLILKNIPLKSITTIKEKGKDAWNIPFVIVGKKTMTLNFIEHEILRKKFSDPRIHVGVNCASISCPKLGNFAFTANNIDDELEKLMSIFINDTNRNSLSAKKIKLSKIFEWFKEDFTKNESLIAYINRYATTKINKKAKIRFLEYNWNLNSN